MTGLFRLIAPMALLLLPMAADAVQDYPSKRLIDSTFDVDIGVFFPQREFRIRVDGSGLSNEAINLQEELKLKDNDEVFSAEVSWGFTERWRLSGQYFGLSNSRSTVLAEDVEWRDIVFQAGSAVRAGTSFSVSRVMLSRDFETQSHHNFGVGIGFHMLRIEAFIEGQAIIQGGATRFRSESVKTDGPMPDIGVWYGRVLSPRWAFSARLDWMEASISPYDGSIVNASIGVDAVLFKHVALGLDYNFFRLNVGIEDSGWRGEVRTQYDGPYLSIKAFW